MKFVIISDVQGNFDAMQGLPEDDDELWVLGGLMNCGPESRGVVVDIMAQASVPDI